MTINIESKRFWINTLQQVFLDTGIYLNKKTNNSAHERDVYDAFRNQAYSFPINLDFSRSWRWGATNFSLINYSPVTNYSSVPAQKKKTKEDEMRAYFWTAVSIVLGSCAALGYLSSKVQRYSKSLNIFTEIDKQIKRHDSGPSNPLQDGLKEIVSNRLETDKILYNYYWYNSLETLLILAGGACLLLGSTYLIEEAIIIGTLSTIFGVAGMLFTYFYNMDNFDDVKRRSEDIYSTTRACLFSLVDDVNVQVFQPQDRPPSYDEACNESQRDFVRRTAGLYDLQRSGYFQ